MRRCVGVAAGIILLALMAGCSTTEAASIPEARSGEPLPYPVLAGATEHEQASIMLACKEARRVQAGMVSAGSVGSVRAAWLELRAGADHLAEGRAVMVWSDLIEHADDIDALEALVGACGRSLT